MGRAGLAMDREAELRAIDHFIEASGVTRVPPRFSGEVQAALPFEEEMRRVAEF